MNIEIGKTYVMNNEAVEVLAYNEKNEILLVKENDENLVFILGDFNVKDGVIFSNNRVNYTVTATEILNCINKYVANGDAKSTIAEVIVKAIRNTYYKIPTQLAEVVAEWYMR